MIGRLFEFLPIRVPKRLTIIETHYYLDGGTTIVKGKDDRGRTRTVTLTQRMLPRKSWLLPPIGRLYLGWRLIPLRGEAEAQLLSVLEAAAFAPSEDSREESTSVPESATVMFGTPDLAALAEIGDERSRMRWMVRQVIDYVRSADSGKLV